MIGHILKMVWNRKRANALVALEIGVSFLVLFGVVALTVFSLGNYRRPLGFSYDNVWNVRIEQNLSSDSARGPEAFEETRQLLQALRDVPEVERSAGAFAAPYSNSRYTSNYERNGRHLEFDRNDVTDGFKDVMNLTLVAGRWFSREDDGAGYVPVVINTQLAQKAFGGTGAVGQAMVERDGDRPEERVIGIISDYRARGEYAAPGNCAFFRMNLDDPRTQAPGSLVLRLRAGTPRSFEESLVAKLQGIAKNDSIRVQPLGEIRSSALQTSRGPILAVALVAAFLMIMVALGLTGVLWQNVTQRTKEIGLRRAKGATGRDVHTQILGEQLVITTLGLLLGTVLAVQIPLLAPLDSVAPSVYIWSFTISLIAMYALTTLCGLYPSRMAARVKPAEALHYD